MNYDDLRKQVERQLNAGSKNNFFQGSNIHNDLLNRAKVSSWGSWGSNFGNNHNDLINKAKESITNWSSWSNWDNLDSNIKNVASSARNRCSQLSGEAKRICENAIGMNSMENDFDENDMARTLANTASEEARNGGMATQVIRLTFTIILIMNINKCDLFIVFQSHIIKFFSSKIMHKFKKF